MAATVVKKPSERILMLCEIIIEAVHDSPHGLPSGHAYAAFQQFGLTLDQYLYLEKICIESGRIKKEHHLLTAVR